MNAFSIRWKEYAAVIFDFDGVIGRTMEDNYRAWQQALSERGVSVGKEEYLLLEGLSARGVAETVLQRRQADVTSIPEIIERKDRYYLDHHAFSFYPEVETLLGLLHPVYRLGLVSGASRLRLTRTVEPPFLNQFAVVITADDVRHPKPDPEPYRTACERMGIRPAQALAIENAPLGIASAKAAGLDCVGICSTLDARYLQQADVSMADITELCRAFTRRT